jgi:hypothetical protein
MTKSTERKRQTRVSLSLLAISLMFIGNTEVSAEKPDLLFDSSFVNTLKQRVSDPWLDTHVVQRFWGEIQKDMEVNADSLYPNGYGIASQTKGAEGGSRIARLAMAYLLTDDIMYARKCDTLIMLYIEDDPYDSITIDKELAVSAWNTAYATVFDWIYSSGVLGSLQDSTSDAYAIREVVCQGCDRLRSFLEAGGYGNNWDVIAATSLALGAKEFPENPNSSYWFTLAQYSINKRLTDHQGHDGDWDEGTFRYHSYAFVYFFRFADMCRHKGIRDYYTDPEFGSSIMNWFRVTLHYTTPTRENLGFNDCVRRETNWVWRPQLYLKGATELGAGMYKWLWEEVDEKLGMSWRDIANTWFYTDALLYYDPGVVPPSSEPTIPPSIHLHKVDYAIFRTDWSDTASLLAFDCGPACSHDHKDKGNFELYYKGVLVVPDVGVAGYDSAHATSRPTAMHNTIQLSGHSQAGEIGVHDGEILDYYTSPSLFFTRGDGHKPLEVAHWTRNVLFVTGDELSYVVLLDEINDSDSNYYLSWMHGRGTECIVGEDSVEWTTPEGYKLRWNIMSSSVPDTILGPYDFCSYTQWIMNGDSSGLVAESIKGVVDMTHAQNLRTLSTVIPRTQSEQYPYMEKDGEAFRISTGSISDVWVSKEDTTQICRYDLTTDGYLGFIRTSQGLPRSWFSRQGTDLSSGSQVLVGSDIRLDLLAGFNQDGNIEGDVGGTGGGSYTLNIYSPQEPIGIEFNGSPVGFSYDSVMKVVDLDLTGNGKLLLDISVGIEESNDQLATGNWQLSIHPNPATHNTVVEFGVHSLGFVDEKPLSLKIYDLSGRVVRNLQINRSPQPEADPPPAENHQITKSSWDGRDNAGKKVRSGIYFVKLKAGDESLETKKLLLLK